MDWVEIKQVSDIFSEQWAFGALAICIIYWAVRKWAFGPVGYLPDHRVGLFLKQSDT